MPFGRTRVFIAHASEEASLAEAIAVKLRAQRLEVFLDSDALRIGDGYDAAIARYIARCDLFVFLLSPSSLSKGRYTLTELGLAKQRWPVPDRRVLPVMAVETPLSDIDPYLESNLHIFKPKGKFTTDVAAAVVDAANELRSKAKRRVLIGLAPVLPIAAGALWFYGTSPRASAVEAGPPSASASGHPAPPIVVVPTPVSPDAGEQEVPEPRPRPAATQAVSKPCHFHIDSDRPWRGPCEAGKEYTKPLEGEDLEKYRRTFSKCGSITVHWCE